MAGRAIVGGEEHVIGGWGAYEVDRRRERWEAAQKRPGSRYPRRTHIGAGDVVRSVLRSQHVLRPQRALTAAAAQLAATLTRAEARMCVQCMQGPGLVLPALTAADLENFANDLEQQRDPNALAQLGVDVGAVAAALGRPLAAWTAPGMPPLPTITAPVDDDRAILRLESATSPYIAAIEELQAAVASRLAEAANS